MCFAAFRKPFWICRMFFVLLDLVDEKCKQAPDDLNERKTFLKANPPPAKDRQSEYEGYGRS